MVLLLALWCTKRDSVLMEVQPRPSLDVNVIIVLRLQLVPAQVYNLGTEKELKPEIISDGTLGQLSPLRFNFCRLTNEWMNEQRCCSSLV